MSCGDVNDVLREIQFEEGETVSCLGVTDQRLFWCSFTDCFGDYQLWMWDRAGDQQTAPLVVLGFTPRRLSPFDEKILVVGDAAVVLFVLEMSETDPPSVTEEFIYGDIACDVSDISWTPDGLTAALATPHAIVLLDCRASYGDLVRSAPLFVDCSSWYGETGAALAVFSASFLFAVSSRNHLVRARCADANAVATAPVMDRDGHILSRAMHVTSLCVGGSAEGHLLVGLSDGSVKLVQQDTLAAFFTIDAAKHALAAPRVPQPVVCLAAGRSVAIVLLPSVCLFYDTGSWDLLADRTVSLADDEPALFALCGGGGSWAAWVPARRALLFSERQGRVGPRGAPTGGGGDVVHAARPLAPRLLKPLALASHAGPHAPPAAKTSKPARASRDRPVTFGRPIRGSGYAADVPWSVAQERKQRAQQRQRASRLPLPSAAPARRHSPLSPLQCPLRAMAAANSALAAAPVHSAVVTAGAFAAGGAALLTASGDGSAHWLKYPVAKHKGEGTSLRAHTAPVNAADVSLSLHAPVVATGAADGLVMLWQPTKRSSPYVQHKVGKDVRAVKFFYTDKFVCYAAGNAVTLCRYVLDDGGGDLDRKRNESAMEPMFEFIAESAQCIAAMDCINYFTSNLILWAGSNKSVGIYDVAAETTIQVVEEAHTRPIHHIAMMTSGRYAAPSIEHLHMYVTAGLDSTVRLWDLRQTRSVRQFALHRNSATPVGLALAPSGAFVAVGSETRAVCVYDIGTGAEVDRVDVRDTPTTLSWHPIDNALAVGTAAGTLQMLGQR